MLLPKYCSNTSSAVILLIYVAMNLALAVESCSLDMKPSYCNVESMFDVKHLCPMTRSSTIKCQYSKIKPSFAPAPSRPMDLFDIPGSPRNFQLELYTVRLYDNCFQVINFTWKLPFGSGSKNLKGFLLNITFVHDNTSKQILRLFELYFNELTSKDLIEVVFHYDCIVPKPETSYRIELHSIPSAEHEEQHYSYLPLRTHGPLVDANNTASWTSWIWTKPNIDASVFEICFSLAPAEFEFSKYNVFLIGLRHGNLRQYDSNVTVEVTPKQVTACHMFSQVCSDFYRIEVEPAATATPKCNCKLQGHCTKKCSPSALENVSMNGSPLPCLFVSRDQAGQEQLTYGFEGKHLIIGMVVGSLLSVFVASLFVHLFRKYQLRKTAFGKATRKKIVILYSNDDENDLNFIQFLANFLQDYCHCEVNLNKWHEPRSRRTEVNVTEADSSETNVKRIQSFIDSSDSTVFFLSRKVCHRYSDIFRGIINPPTSTGSYESLDVVSDILKLTMSKDKDSISKKSYQILFMPSAKNELALNKLVKECYSLPDDIRCFLKTICGISTFCKERKKALATLESTLIRQPLLRSPVDDDNSHELNGVSTINNNRFSSTDLNCEENSLPVHEIEGGRFTSETSGDSAYYSGVVHEDPQLQFTWHSSNGTAPLASTVSLVTTDDLGILGQRMYSEFYEIEFKSFLAPSSIGTSCEDVEHID